MTVNIRNLLNATYISTRPSRAASTFGAPITAIASLRVFSSYESRCAPKNRGATHKHNRSCLLINSQASRLQNRVSKDLQCRICTGALDRRCGFCFLIRLFH